MSLRRYCSRTTFCTLPLFSDRMKTLLEMLAVLSPELRFKLFILRCQLGAIEVVGTGHKHRMLI